MQPFSIAGRPIGPEHPPFVIAELGVNHEGDIQKALALLDAAVAAGADCVKIQTHLAPKEMIDTGISLGFSDEKLYQVIERCELTPDEEAVVKRRCIQKGVQFLSTPFSREASDRLEKLGVDGYKIGSGECNNVPFLEHVARKRQPTILSTGMNDMPSIARALKIFKQQGTPLMLMHCTSIYPTPYDKVRLGAIAELREAFDVPVGLSDHSPGVYTCLGAVALGACALEKHFTISRSWPGPDMPVSIEPQELAEMVTGARAIHMARGGKKGILDEEKPVIDFAYASVVSIRAISEGETFGLENVWVKRPGTGRILAPDFTRVIGRKARRAIPNDRQIAPEDVEGF